MFFKGCVIVAFRIQGLRFRVVGFRLRDSGWGCTGFRGGGRAGTLYRIWNANFLCSFRSDFIHSVSSSTNSTVTCAGVRVWDLSLRELGRRTGPLRVESVNLTRVPICGSNRLEVPSFGRVAPACALPRSVPLKTLRGTTLPGYPWSFVTKLLTHRVIPGQ